MICKEVCFFCKGFWDEMTRPRWPKHYPRLVYDKDRGACHHCGTPLRFEERNTWHIDHFPVAYRDIEDQCCFGVRDPLDMSNLVLSCVSCNVSHVHERRIWCGRSQIRCKKVWFRWGCFIFAWCVSIGITYSVAHVVC